MGWQRLRDDPDLEPLSHRIEASGIGRAIAEQCVREGAHVVLADIEEPALRSTARALTELGAQVLAVHLLFNIAGVAAGTTVWESTLADWTRVMGINLNGVFHGIHTFGPRMLAQDDECHIVNTASIAGLISSPGLGIYKASKHAVVSLSETLSCELAERGVKIKVSVLCPYWVKTQILRSQRNRSPALENPSSDCREVSAWAQAAQLAVKTGMEPHDVAGHVFDAIRGEHFYILTHPDWNPLIQQRMDNILQGRPPA